MKRITWIYALAVLTLAVGCQKEAEFQTNDTVKSVTFTITDFTDGDADTKTSFNEGGGFLWAPNDTVGIYPDTGSQVWFELTAGAEASSAQFDGGGWAFKASSMYYSYYPFIGDIYLDRNHIPVSYVGQKQTGTTSTSHIGQFDFMYTPGASSSSGNVNFRYRHLNSLLYVTATLPAGSYKKLAITAPTECFVKTGWYDLMADQPAIVAETHTNQMLINLEDITLSEQTTFRVYLMLAPVNLNGVQVTVSVLNSRNKELQCKKTPSREYVAGSYYGLTCSAFTQVPASEALIEVDDEPGTIPNNEIWYHTSNGELLQYLSYDLKSQLVSNTYEDGKGVLIFNSPITEIPEGSFYYYVDPEQEDLIDPKYETQNLITRIELPPSVSSIHNSFSGLSSLEEVVLPEGLVEIIDSFNALPSLTQVSIPSTTEIIRDYCFYKCPSLVSIRVNEGNAKYDSRSNCNAIIETQTNTLVFGCVGTVIPNTIEIIGKSAFYGRIGLTTINLPESVKTIEEGAFSHCENLTEIDLSFITKIGVYAFGQCSNLTSIILGDYLSEIGNEAFAVTGLTSVVLPASIKTIPERVFMYSPLTSITCLATTPPILSNTSEYSHPFIYTNDCPIYVPANSVPTYKEQWAIYSSRIFPIQEQALPEAVDLGLSVKWASFNLGASSPSDVGVYFSWGETSPNGEYSLDTYTWCNGSNETMKKYCYDAHYGYNGFTDDLITLEMADDAATVAWGEGWRIPTKEDYEELIANCDYEWVEDYNQSGVCGIVFSSRITDNSLFIPASGLYYDGGLHNEGIINVWTSSLAVAPDDIFGPSCAYHLFYNPQSNRAPWVNFGRRYSGLTIRPVFDN